MTRWTIGEVRVTALVEAETPLPAGLLLPVCTAEALADVAWLGEPFLTAAGDVVLAIQTFIVEAAGKRIVVDTCMGNDKHRVGGAGHMLCGDYLARLAAAGFARDNIDIVLCTHLHFDHVGWNTMLVDGVWVPTFPRARYLFGRTKLDHLRAANAPDDQALLADSVQPLLDRGLVDLVDTDHRIVAGLRLVPTPGHTPGHVSVLIESDGQRALISGDFLHSPLQIARPDWSAFVDHDPAQAVKTRRAMLAHLAAEPALLIGTHFPAPTGGRVARDDDGYRFVV